MSEFAQNMHFKKLDAKIGLGPPESKATLIFEMITRLETAQGWEGQDLPPLTHNSCTNTKIADPAPRSARKADQYLRMDLKL